MKIHRLLSLLSVIACVALTVAEAPALTCSLSEDQENELDPALQEMKYDVGDGNGEQSVLVYVEPDVTTFYQGDPPASTKVVPKFKGLAAKFINMSNRAVTLYWVDDSGKRYSMRKHPPFSPSGTASFPGHTFIMTADDDPENVLKTFNVKAYPHNLYWYDPYYVEGDEATTEKNLKVLTKEERKKYDGWRCTLSFNEQYFNVTGRSYLANYLREPPKHYMWRADYFGQEHWITTKETHFVKLPDEVQQVATTGRKRILKESDPRILQEYRDPNQEVMNMTLRALSCAPRVFEIPNFLSQVEVDHVLDIAGGINLHKSQTGLGSGEDADEKDDTKTRTSYNSWVPREKTDIVDAIYRRAADLMRIDEALLRYRDPDEYPDVPSKRSLGEQLQLVHYGLTQEYTAHHDFGYSDIDDTLQPARFATLLFYLNDGMTGGETSFPRWINAESFEELAVTPEAGKAVLFYSQLPDGNLDDFSQHAALPITDGEKWLINLWTWDPVYEK